MNFPHMTEPAITPELVAKHNLTPDEYKKILEVLGRTARDLFVPQHAEAERVHERIALIGLVEIHLARDGRNAEAIPVMRDAADDASEEAAVVFESGFVLSVCSSRGNEALISFGF